MLNLFPTSARFDQSTVELLLWYEAIFGKEMWKHVIVETTFWSHSSEAAALRSQPEIFLDFRLGSLVAPT